MHSLNGVLEFLSIELLHNDMRRLHHGADLLHNINYSITVYRRIVQQTTRLHYGIELLHKTQEDSCHGCHNTHYGLHHSAELLHNILLLLLKSQSFTLRDDWSCNYIQHTSFIVCFTHKMIYLQSHLNIPPYYWERQRFQKLHVQPC